MTSFGHHLVFDQHDTLYVCLRSLTEHPVYPQLRGPGPRAGGAGAARGTQPGPVGAGGRRFLQDCEACAEGMGDNTGNRIEIGSAERQIIAEKYIHIHTYRSNREHPFLKPVKNDFCNALSNG